ncbi:MAG: hypothetical protein DRO63_02745 [Candidatus Gerdarchaeota archaeon]|nr:MAG: hypothetical protein DRO63_02745 [Candidatus Gerdarchaeota archaeon]
MLSPKNIHVYKKICLFFFLPLTFTLVATSLSESGAVSCHPISDGAFLTNGVYYSHWNETIVVGMDGSLLITEEMTFYLSAGSYGYAYRELKWQSFHDVVSWNIASGAGTPAITSYKMEKEIDRIKFYWEWPRSYVSEGTEYTFSLTYNVSSAMDLRGNRDRVYWNVIGSEFEYTIYDVSTKVIFPKQYNLSDIRSTTYYNGKNPGDDTGTAMNENGHTVVVFHQGKVAPLTSYTIDTDSPPAGIVMPFSWRVYLNQTPILVFAIAFLPLFLTFLLLFLFKGLDPKAKVIPTLNEVAINKCPSCGYKDFRQVRFCSHCGSPMKILTEVAPPDALTPVEVGVLLDEKVDNIDFVAEFFYLAEQDYLRIIQLPDEDEIYFQLTGKTPSYGALSSFSKDVLAFVKKHSSDTIWTKKTVIKNGKEQLEEVGLSVLSLSSIKIHVSSLWSKKDKIYNKLAGGDMRYFEGNPEKARQTFSRLAFFGGVMEIIGFFFLFNLLHISAIIAMVVGSVLAAIFGFFLANKMPKLTKQGAQAKVSWQNYLQLIRGKMLAFPDPYEQFNFSMDHFSYLLVDPKFDLPAYLERLAKNVQRKPAPEGYSYVAPYWYYYPGIRFSPRGGFGSHPIRGIGAGKSFASIADGIGSMAESIPMAISNFTEGISQAIKNMSNNFTPPSSSGGSSGFGGGFSGGGGGGGGGGIG